MQMQSMHFPRQMGASRIKRTFGLQQIMRQLAVKPDANVIVVSMRQEHKKEFVKFAEYYGVKLDVGRNRRRGQCWQFQVKSWSWIKEEE